MWLRGTGRRGAWSTARSPSWIRRKSSGHWRKARATRSRAEPPCGRACGACPQCIYWRLTMESQPHESGSREVGGARHFQHYEIDVQADGTTLFELGRGAMGVTYKARDVNL